MTTTQPDDIESVPADPWTRFDLWAERAFQYCEQAIDSSDADATEASAQTKTLLDSAMTCGNLAAFSAPDHRIPPPKPEKNP